MNRYAFVQTTVHIAMFLLDLTLLIMMYRISFFHSLPRGAGAVLRKGAEGLTNKVVLSASAFLRDSCVFHYAI